MKITGIVTEDIPFHKGFGQPIENVRKIAKCDVLIAIMPACFSQRGEPVFMDKWLRTRHLLDAGVDLVIELPFALSVRSIGHYAQAVVDLLELAGVEEMIFASETNNLEELRQFASMSFSIDGIKENLDLSNGYPSSYNLQAGAYYPNDIKAIAYLRAMDKKQITPCTFQSEPVDSMIAQTSDEYISWSDYYPFLRWKLLTQDHDSLSKLFLFDEGIASHLLKHSRSSDSWETFLSQCVKRRYTPAYIQRTCVHLLVHTLKDKIRQIQPLTTLRILGFNDIGRAYLNVLKSQDIRVASRFNQIPFIIRELEYKAMLSYVSPMSSERRNAIVEREMGGPIILTDKD